MTTKVERAFLTMMKAYHQEFRWQLMREPFTGRSLTCIAWPEPFPWLGRWERRWSRRRLLVPEIRTRAGLAWEMIRHGYSSRLFEP